MSEEIQQAVQIIRVAYDGIEIAMKVGSGSIGQMKKAVDFMIALLEHEKLFGKTAMHKLLQKGGDLQVLQFNTEDIKKIEKMAKKYGILYSVLPDINKADGKSEIIFHTEAVPRVNMMIQKLKFGRISTFDDYLKNGNEKELDNVISFLKEQKKEKGFPQNVRTEETVRVNDLMDGLIEKVGIFAMEKQSISVDEVKENFNIENEQAEGIIIQLEKIGAISKEENGQHKVIMDKEDFSNRIRGYQELADRMRSVSASNNMNLVNITITRKLIVEENDHAIKTRIPYGGGKCIWIEKKDIMEIHNGKTLLTFLDKNKDYKIYSAANHVIETIKGEALYDSHYDSVSMEVKKRYQSNERNAANMIRKAPAPKKSSL